jgi:hypothetical protein
MRTLVAAALASVAFATPSVAQTSRGATTQTFVQYCIASPHMAGRTTPEPSCACAAGVLSGQMTDRQYGIAGRLTPFTGNNEGMSNEIRTMIGEGYTAEEIVAVGNLMVAAESLIDGTCRPLDR